MMAHRRLNLDLLTCPNCNNQYQVFNEIVPFPIAGHNKKGPAGIPLLPLILECGHSVCQKCVVNRSIAQGHIVCGSCLTSTSLKKINNKQLHNHFPINYYIIGFLLYGSKPQGTIPFAKNAFLSSLMSKCNTSKSSKANCDECHKNEIECHCNDCKITLCTTCFKNIHKFKTLSHHIPSSLEVKHFVKLTLPQCKVHDKPNDTLHMYCDDCLVSCCPTCISQTHENHKVSNISEINKNSTEKLTAVQHQLAEIKPQLENMLKETSEHLKKKQTLAASLNGQIENHFLQLHTVLQHLEFQLKKRISGDTGDVFSCLENLESILKEKLGASNIFSDQMRLITTQDYCETANYPVLTEEIEKFIEDSKQYFRADNLENVFPKFIFNEEIYGVVKDHAKIEIENNVLDTLVSEGLLKQQDLSSSIPSSANSQTSQGNQSYHSCKSLDQINSGRSSRISIGSTHDVTPKPLTPGKWALIHVSHVINPSLFYVQHVVDKEHYSDQCLRYEKIAKSLPKLTKVEKDHIYFVFANDEWHRGLVKQVIESEDENTICEIFFIDYGNTEKTSIENLREMKSEYKNIVAKAFRCSLYDITPTTEKSSDDATLFMLRIINNKNVRIQVVSIVDGTHFVDLLALPSDYNEMSVSVRDALIFAKLISISKTGKGSSIQKLFNKEKINIPPHKNLKKDQIVDVTVSTVINPNKFYIHLDSDQTIIEDLKKQMKEKYKNRANKGYIYCPEIGMLCAVGIDDNWYRAKIVNLPGCSQVEMTLIDYGATITTSWEKIRKLTDEFKHTCAQTLLVSLCEVVPVSETWSEEAITFFKNTVLSKTLRMKVIDDSPPAKVILFEQFLDHDVNVNGLLVKENHAKSTGISSRFSEFFRLKTETAATNQTTSSKKEKSSEKPQPSQQITNNASRIEVTVLTAINPGCIYVRPTSRREQLLKLPEALEAFYSKTSASDKINWQVKEVCAVFVNGCWYRGIIGGIDDDNPEMFNVFLKDQVRYETVPKTNLRVLDDRFKSVPDGSVKCHLFGIKAAGDKENVWPVSTCERLNNLIAECNELYVVKKSKCIESQSLGVHLLQKAVVDCGALELPSVKWISLNRVLVNEGLAIPDKNSKETSDLSEFEISMENEMAGTIIDWSNVPKTPDCQEINQTFNYTVAIDKWISALPLAHMKFDAFITHVDDDMIIYLYDITQKHNLKMIETALNEHYADSKCDNTRWFDKKICIVESNGNYYRGEVLKVNDNDVLVHFVDYGIKEICQISQLRNDLILQNIPIQVTECKLDKIIPNNSSGHWKKDAIQIVQKLVLDKEVLVNVKNIESKIVAIELYNEDTAVNETLVDLGFARWSQKDFDTFSSSIHDLELSATMENLDSVSVADTQSYCSDKSSELDVLEATLIKANQNYVELEIPTKVDRLEVGVVSVGDDYLTWYLQPCGTNNFFLRDSLRYETIFKEMQEDAADLLPIRNPKCGKPCCALYKEDNQWYRGEIYQNPFVNASQYLIFFSDFGNIEFVDKENVRALKPHWLQIPLQCIKCKLNGIEKADDIADDLIQDEMSKILFNDMCIAEVKTRKPLTVDLLCNVTNTLKYQPLIEQNILIQK